MELILQESKLIGGKYKNLSTAFLCIILLVVILACSLNCFINNIKLIMTVDFLLASLTFLNIRTASPILCINILLFNYYCYAFPANYVFNLIDIESVTIISSLSKVGALYPIDIYTSLLVWLIAKNAFQVAALISCAFSSQDLIFFSTRGMNTKKNQTILLLSISLCYFLEKISGIFGLIIIPLVIIFILQVVLCFSNRSKIKGVISYLAIAIILFTATRSRLILGVISAILFAKICSEGNLRFSRVFVGGFFLLILFNLYGVMRDWPVTNQGTSRYENYWGRNGVDAMGEAGHVFLISTHIIGLKIRNNFEINDNFFDKVLLAIPGLERRNNIEPLADRYVNYYFPQIEVGGFGFPLVAEIHVWQGITILICFFSIIAIFIKKIEEVIVNNNYGLAVVFILSMSWLRTEISQTLYKIIVFISIYCIYKVSILIFNSMVSHYPLGCIDKNRNEKVTS